MKIAIFDYPSYSRLAHERRRRQTTDRQIDWRATIKKN